jgi:hypothetical protein
MSTTPNELHHYHKKIHTRRPTLDKDRNKGRVGNISVVIYRGRLNSIIGFQQNQCLNIKNIMLYTQYID